MGTTIGLVADIHAEGESLQAALTALQRRGVDYVICMGDLVEKGPDGNAVVARIRADGIPCVMGNHDYAALENQLWLRENGDPDILKRRGWWLTDSTLNYLRSLPRTLRFTWEGISVMMAHGAPWSYSQYVFATSRRPIFERVVREARTQIVVLGHTHIPMRVQFDDVLVVNPGSVCGRRSTGSQTCAILTLPEGRFELLSLGETDSGTVVNQVDGW